MKTNMVEMDSNSIFGAFYNERLLHIIFEFSGNVYSDRYDLIGSIICHCGYSTRNQNWGIWVAEISSFASNWKWCGNDKSISVCWSKKEEYYYKTNIIAEETANQSTLVLNHSVPENTISKQMSEISEKPYFDDFIQRLEEHTYYMYVQS